MTNALVAELFDRYHQPDWSDFFRCQLCGRTAADGTRLEVDHRMPRARGGRDSAENLWTLCLECNRGKLDDLI